ncbi:MAG: DNA internalization-related competence protein ComEC/Rec2 [Armatimonadetes bacterium]|nr:DNA internalization-related competence protein ComEC/Rec2 [Armatimonadota bacterium]
MSAPAAGPSPPTDHWFPLVHRPLLALCLCFLVGIWLGSRWPIHFGVWLGLGLAGAVAGAATRRLRVAAPAYGLGVLACGAFLACVQAMPRRDDIARFVRAGEPVTVEGYVLSELPSRGFLHQYVLRAVRLETDATDREVSGRVLLRTHGREQRLDGLPVRCEGTVRVPQAATNPGEFDLAALLARRRVSAVINVTSLAGAEHLPLPVEHRVRRGAASLRRTIVAQLRTSMPGPNADYYADLLASIVFGVEVTPVPQAIAESFRRTGAIHLLVVSGAQLSLIAMTVLFLCSPRRSAVWRWIGERMGRGDRRDMVPRIRCWQTVLAVGALAFFTLMVGTGPSVSRALAMVLLMLGAGIFDYDYDPYTALGFAAAAICLLDPAALFSIGAQLSFGATLGVLVALRSLAAATPHIPGPVPIVAWAGAGALGSWLIVTPLLAYHFGAFPLLGAVANVVAVPVCGVAMILTWIAIPLSWIHDSLGAIPLWPARVLMYGMTWVNEVCGNLRGAYVESTHFSALACISWYAALALIACAYRARVDLRTWLSPKRAAGLALVALVGLSVWFAIDAYRTDRLTVTFLSVGHGQCCVVQSPAGRALMVDAGSAETLGSGQQCAREVILPFLATRGIKRLDAVVISHPDADHCNALPAVLAEIPVGTILESFPAEGGEVYSLVKAAAAAERVPMRKAAAGGIIELGGSVWAEVLWPTGTASDRAFDDNNRSVVLRLTHGQVSVLLPGDIGVDAESELIRRNAPLSATVLQVPHHGSANSSSWPFLEAVRPMVAVASCKTADPAHPAPSIQARLNDLGVELWRTDRDGAVTVVSDGRQVTVNARGRRRAQNLSPVTEQAWASASRRRSGSVSASSAISGASRERSASISRRLISARTSASSSNLRSRNLWTVPRSSGVRLAARGRSIGARPSVASASAAGG